MPTSDELAQIRRQSKIHLVGLVRLGEVMSPESDRARAGRLARLELDRRRARDLGDGEEQRRLWLEQNALVEEGTAS